MNESQRRTLEMLIPSYAADPGLLVQRGKLSEQLHLDIEATEKIKLLVAGQRGMGKTTELRRLVQLLENANINVFFIQFGSLEAISHPLLIQEMVTKVLETTKMKINTKLRKKLSDWYSEEEIEESTSEGSEGSASIGGNLVILKGSKGVKHARSTSSIQKKKVKRDLHTLFELFNDLLNEARKHSSKRIVFIVDDIDKIQDATSIEKTFVQNSHLIDLIDAPCVFTVPISYTTSATVRIAALPYSEIYRVPAVALSDRNGKRVEPAYDFMREVMKRRMPFNPVPIEMIDLILELSGGVLIDAMRLVRGVCRSCVLDPKKTVDAAMIDREFTRLVDDYKFVFNSVDQWTWLSKVCNASDRSVILTTPNLPELLYKMIVIEYRDENLWFDLHPAARRLYRDNCPTIEAAVAEKADAKL